MILETELEAVGQSLLFRSLPQAVPEPLDEAQRQELLLRHLPQVHFIARRIHRRVPPQVLIEDLVNAGVIGLLDAVRKYDAARNVKFKYYAEFRIRGAILDSLREVDWGPRSLRRQARELRQAISDCRARFGRNPTELEIAAALKLGLPDLQHLLGELSGLDVSTFHEDSGDTPAGQKVLHYRANKKEEDPYQRTLNFEMSYLLTEAVAELPDREREVVTLYHLDELTMKEVGVVLGIGESRVSQVHATALMHLRTQLYTRLRTKLA
jgi:RNA polymerase sigma factor for flagellar operon FliA